MTVPHVKNPCWSRSWRTAPFGKDPHCQFMMYPMGPLSRAGEEFEAEGSAERKCYGLTTTLTPHPTVPFRGEEIDESGVKLNMGRSGVGRGDLNSAFVSLHPTLF